MPKNICFVYVLFPIIFFLVYIICIAYDFNTKKPPIQGGQKKFLIFCEIRRFFIKKQWLFLSSV